MEDANSYTSAKKEGVNSNSVNFQGKGGRRGKERKSTYLSDVAERRKTKETYFYIIVLLCGGEKRKKKEGASTNSPRGLRAVERERRKCNLYSKSRLIKEGRKRKKREEEGLVDSPSCRSEERKTPPSIIRREKKGDGRHYNLSRQRGRRKKKQLMHLRGLQRATKGEKKKEGICSGSQTHHTSIYYIAGEEKEEKDLGTRLFILNPAC